MENTVPQLDDDRPLDPDVVRGFSADGHAIVRELLTPREVRVLRDAVRDAVSRFNTETRALEERDTYDRAFLQTTNLWPRDERVRHFTLAQRFASVAAQLLQVDRVRVYHDQALYKEPGGGHTPFHQDQHYWPLDDDRTVTMWMALVDIPEEVGSLRFASGSHRLGYLGDVPISDESERRFTSFIEERGLSIAHYGAMRAGDATFHAGWTLHAAQPNPTSAMREVMTVIYMADGARLIEPEHDGHRSSFDAWFSDRAVGDLADGPLQPLVYGD